MFVLYKVALNITYEEGVKELKKLIDIELLKKKTPSQPTADYLEEEFMKFLEYCQERELTPTKHSWRVFLNVLDQTVGGWMDATRNTTTLSEEEYLKRREVIKKIDKNIENALSESLITSDRTNGNLIFYLKNSYKWTDRPQQEEVTVNIKTKGFMPSEKKKK